MKNAHRLLVGLMLSTLALGLTVPNAAAKIHYRAGIGLGAGDQQEFTFERPGTYHFTLMIVVWPLWYAQEDLDTYDTVTLILRLIPYRTGSGPLPILLADNCLTQPDGAQLCTWKDVRLSQDEYGITLDATLRLGVTLIAGSDTALGGYALKMDAIATAGPNITFEGHSSMRVVVWQLYMPS